jgi:hypothetical protein
MIYENKYHIEKDSKRKRSYIYNPEPLSDNKRALNKRLNETHYG